MIPRDTPAGSGDAPSLVEIEITSAMIEAGMNALEEHLFEDGLTGLSRPVAVRAIYCAMYRAAKR